MKPYGFLLKIFGETCLGQYFTFFPHIEGLVVPCMKVLTGLNLVSMVPVVGCIKHCNELQHFINVELLLINLKKTNFSKVCSIGLSVYPSITFEVVPDKAEIQNSF